MSDFRKFSRMCNKGGTTGGFTSFHKDFSNWKLFSTSKVPYVRFFIVRIPTLRFRTGVTWMKRATNINLVQNLTGRVHTSVKILFATCYLIYLCSRAYLLKHPMLRILMDFGFRHQHKLVISVAFWGCYHQRSSVALAAWVLVEVGRLQQPYDFNAALCPHQGSVPVSVGQVLVGTGLQQQMRDFNVALLRCQHQGSAPRTVGQVLFGTGLQQQAHDFRVAGVRMPSSAQWYRHRWLCSCRHRHPAANARLQCGLFLMLASERCRRHRWPSSFRHRPPAANARLPHGLGQMPASVDDFRPRRRSCRLGAEAAAKWPSTCSLILSLSLGPKVARA